VPLTPLQATISTDAGVLHVLPKVESLLGVRGAALQLSNRFSWFFLTSPQKSNLNWVGNAGQVSGYHAYHEKPVGPTRNHFIVMPLGLIIVMQCILVQCNVDAEARALVGPGGVGGHRHAAMHCCSQIGPGTPSLLC
jgi:hypothetical protein